MRNDTSASGLSLSGSHSPSQVDDSFLSKLEESYTKARHFALDEGTQEKIQKGRRDMEQWSREVKPGDMAM
jgi:hypothetical protein